MGSSFLSRGMLTKSINRLVGFFFLYVRLYRSSRPEVFLEKGVPKICSKFTGEHPCRSAISRKNTYAEVQSNFIEITLWHGCSPVNLLHIFRTPFLKNTCEWLLQTPRLIFFLNDLFGSF